MEHLPQKEWFENWFDTPFYHQLYKDRNDVEAQNFIDNLFLELSIPSDAKVLDIACGKGRHSIYMERKGFEVTGIDLSGNSIEYARRFETNKLDFFRHDMRDVFRVNYFDCAVNLFTSLGYFQDEKDNTRTIQSAATNLKKGGLLVVDFFNADWVESSLQKKMDKQCDETMFHITKKIENRTVIKTIHFENEGKSYQFQETVSLLKLNDFEKMFISAELTLYKVFGNYQLADFNVADSPRLILLGRKV